MSDSAGQAGSQRLGAVQGFEATARGLILDCGGPRLALSVLAAEIVRVRLAPTGDFAPRRSWAVNRPDEDFAPVPFTIYERGPMIELRTTRMTVRIERATGQIACTDSADLSDHSGRLFCADEAGVAFGRLNWAQTFVADDDATSASARQVACTKRIEPGEHFFGFGQRTGPLERTGREMRNWTTDPATAGHGPATDPLYIAIPVLLAVRPGLAYGVYFNNTWRSWFRVGSERPGVWTMAADGGELDYYILYGPEPAGVTTALARVLGTLPLPPRWALGYHQSRWGYASAQAVRDVAATLRAHDLPCDVIHMDIDHMRGYRVFTWNTEQFPEPAALLHDLRRQGFRVVTIIDPGVKIDPDYHVYREGLEGRMFICMPDGTPFRGYVWPGAAVFADYTRPEVRAWWGDLQKPFVDQGVSGIWNDMDEPAVFDRDFAEGPGVVGTIALDAVQGAADEPTTHAEVHNLYGQGMVQACYEGLRRHMGDERPFVLNRSCFAGGQRWSACWMGDNNSIWEHLELVLPQLMNMGLSGMPFVGTDIGGFFGNANGELLARWVQVGILSPLCRNHSCAGTTSQEPWAFGPEVEAIYRDYLKLRYRLLPYLYSLFWEAAERGTPILRPLFYHFPDDPATYPLHDEALLGPALLAAPVYQPGRTCRAVYLPAGEWFDWWTEERFRGPTNILAAAPLERLPLYVRAGAILPTGPAMAYADEQPLNPLTLDVYPPEAVAVDEDEGEGEQAHTFTLYEDDGHSFAYERGEFCTTRYTLRTEPPGAGPQDGSLVFEIGTRTGAYSPPPRQLVIRLHGAAGYRIPDEPGAGYDPARQVLTLELADTGAARVLRFLCAPGGE